MGHYLNTYGKKRKFQEGGAMAPAPEAGGAPPAPEAAPGGGGEEELFALAEAAVQGDQEAATQLGMALAPMILEQASAMGQEAGGGAEQAPPEGGTPVFGSGGKFLRKV